MVIKKNIIFIFIINLCLFTVLFGQDNKKKNNASLELINGQIYLHLSGKSMGKQISEDTNILLFKYIDNSPPSGTSKIQNITQEQLNDKNVKWDTSKIYLSIQPIQPGEKGNKEYYQNSYKGKVINAVNKLELGCKYIFLCQYDKSSFSIDRIKVPELDLLIQSRDSLLKFYFKKMNIFFIDLDPVAKFFIGLMSAVYLLLLVIFMRWFRCGINDRGNFLHFIFILLRYIFLLSPIILSFLIPSIVIISMCVLYLFVLIFIIYPRKIFNVPYDTIKKNYFISISGITSVLLVVSYFVWLRDVQIILFIIFGLFCLSSMVILGIFWYQDNNIELSNQCNIIKHGASVLTLDVIELFNTAVSLFPMMGFIGTIVGLMYASNSDGQLTDANIPLALVTTFLGLLFCIFTYILRYIAILFIKDSPSVVNSTTTSTRTIITTKVNNETLNNV